MNGNEISTCVSPSNLGDIRKDHVILVNINRAKQEAALVKPKSNIDQEAQRFACELAASKRVSHVSIDGSTLRDRHDAEKNNFCFLGENLAKGFINVGDVVDHWIKSPGHRKNIHHSRAEFIGLGVAFGSEREATMVWVQVVAGTC